MNQNAAIGAACTREDAQTQEVSELKRYMNTSDAVVSAACGWTDAVAVRMAADASAQLKQLRMQMPHDAT